MFMKNSGKNSVRDHCDGFNLENNNNLWVDEYNPHELHREEFTWVKKKVRGGMHLLILMKLLRR